jgi:hypothetical protein
MRGDPEMTDDAMMQPLDATELAAVEGGVAMCNPLQFLILILSNLGKPLC